MRDNEIHTVQDTKKGQRHMKILIVEDEPKVGKALSEGLKASGDEVTLARTGEEGRHARQLQETLLVFPARALTVRHSRAASRSVQILQWRYRQIQNRVLEFAEARGGHLSPRAGDSAAFGN